MTIAVSSTTGWRHYVNKQLVHSCPNARPSFAQTNTQDLFIGRFRHAYTIVKIRNSVAFATGRTCLWLTLCLAPSP